ncbi:MAG: ATP-binding cassette domain-containing protein [Oscillospiraceae bacterium]
MSEIQNAIEVKNLKKGFGGRVLFENFSLNVKANTIHAIIGPNGSGKTTLLRLITGVYQPNAGTINMNWFKSIPIFATLLHILLVVLKCGIFMKTNNVWVLLLFSPVSIIVLTACGLCLMTKERIVSSYY